MNRLILSTIAVLVSATSAQASPCPTDNCMGDPAAWAAMQGDTPAPAPVSRTVDTFNTWRVDRYTTCGVRRHRGRVERFVAKHSPAGLSYDFAPSDSKWRFERCDVDPNEPPPTLEGVIARLENPPPPPTCAELQAAWAKMTPRDRAYVRSVRAKDGPAGCEVAP